MKLAMRTPDFRAADVIERLPPLADAAMQRAGAAARAIRERARERAPSTDDVLAAVGLERRRGASWRLLSWPLLFAAGIGAALLFFLDPDGGRRRRAMARDRASGWIRDAGRVLDRGGRFAGAQAYGIGQKLTHLRCESVGVPNDATLVDRVMSEAFRGLDPDLKGRVNVNAVGGVVYVRGELEHPEEIDAIEGRIQRVPGVEEVENLLHLTGSPAPSAR